MTTPPARAWHHPACSDDETLLAQCDLSKGRRRGPGGQHRNKVETAVELLHQPTGLTGQASECRSVADNKRLALRRLRLTLAVEARAPVPTGEIGSELWRSRVCHKPARRAGRRADTPSADPVFKELGVKLRVEGADAGAGRIACNPDHHDYPALLAEALDVIAGSGWDPKPAALRLGVSATQLVRLVRDHPPAMLRLNQERAARSMHALK